MRLTLSPLGFELDVTLGRETVDDDDPGSCTSYPVGFVRDDGAPFEVDMPHRFDRAEGDEDA